MVRHFSIYFIVLLNNFFIPGDILQPPTTADYPFKSHAPTPAPTLSPLIPPFITPVFNWTNVADPSPVTADKKVIIHRTLSFSPESLDLLGKRNRIPLLEVPMNVPVPSVTSCKAFSSLLVSIQPDFPLSKLSSGLSVSPNDLQIHLTAFTTSADGKIDSKRISVERYIDQYRDKDDPRYHNYLLTWPPNWKKTVVNNENFAYSVEYSTKEFDLLLRPHQSTAWNVSFYYVPTFSTTNANDLTAWKDVLSLVSYNVQLAFSMEDYPDRCGAGENHSFRQGNDGETVRPDQTKKSTDLPSLRSSVVTDGTQDTCHYDIMVIPFKNIPLRTYLDTPASINFIPNRVTLMNFYQSGKFDSFSHYSPRYWIPL